MRGDLQDIFKMTPHEKQVMMFSATLSKEIRPICKKFMSNVSCPSFRTASSIVARLRARRASLRQRQAAVHRWRARRGSRSAASCRG